jgi:hypothetical protein
MERHPKQTHSEGQTKRELKNGKTLVFEQNLERLASFQEVIQNNYESKTYRDAKEDEMLYACLGLHENGFEILMGNSRTEEKAHRDGAVIAAIMAVKLSSSALFPWANQAKSAKSVD